MPQLAQANDIVPDGGTTTSTSTDISGKVIVQIAPKVGEISHNTYTDFSVSAPGVELNNGTVGANIILNEVTSANRSVLAGDIIVLGDKAHVIIANPNGISIDGAHFSNVDGAALITAQIVSPTGNPSFNVTSGDILIENNGLSGALTQLDLVAKSIGVSGPVLDEATLASLRLTAGASKGTIDPLAAPDTTTRLVETASAGDIASNNAVTIASAGELNGGLITITTTDKGAGVNFEGAALASSRDFFISSSGKVQFGKAKVKAQNALIVAAQEIEIFGEGSQFQAMDSGVALESSGNTFIANAVVQGTLRAEFGFASSGAVSVRADGAINIGTGNQFIGQNDSIEFIAAQYISALQSEYTSNKDILFSAANAIALTDAKARAVNSFKSLSDGDIEFTTSDIQATQFVELDGNNISLTGDQDTRTLVVSDQGGVLIKADGGLKNFGALVSGIKRNEEQAGSNGAVSVVAQSLHLETISENSIGAFFGSEDDLYIQIAGDVTNLSGRFLSNRHVNITAGGRFFNDAKRTDDADINQEGDAIVKRRGGAIIGGRTTSYNYGTKAVGNEIGLITAQENISITAAQFINIGGELTAKNITINADKILNKRAQFGEASIRRNCFLIFCDADSTSDVTLDGGLINATEILTLNGNQNVINMGGVLIGADAINIGAPSIELRTLLVPNAFTRPGGWLPFWGTQQARLIFTFVGGTLFSSSGKITLTAEGKIIAEATTIASSDEAAINPSIDERDVPSQLVDMNTKNIGHFGNLLP